MQEDIRKAKLKKQTNTTIIFCGPPLSYIFPKRHFLFLRFMPLFESYSLEASCKICF